MEVGAKVIAQTGEGERVGRIELISSDFVFVRLTENYTICLPHCCVRPLE